MQKPIVTDTKLQKLVNDLFRDNAKIGNGSAGAALRHEMKTGQPVGQKEHLQKTQNYIVSLERWLKNNPKASDNDKMAAELILRDLKNALKGK